MHVVIATFTCITRMFQYVLPCVFSHTIMLNIFVMNCARSKCGSPGGVDSRLGC